MQLVLSDDLLYSVYSTMYQKNITNKNKKLILVKRMTKNMNILQIGNVFTFKILE